MFFPLKGRTEGKSSCFVYHGGIPNESEWSFCHVSASIIGHHNLKKSCLCTSSSFPSLYFRGFSCSQFCMKCTFFLAQPVIQQDLSFSSRDIRCHHDNPLWQTLSLAGLAQISVRCWSERIQLGFPIHPVVGGKQWFVQSQTEIILAQSRRISLNQ